MKIENSNDQPTSESLTIGNNMLSEDFVIGRWRGNVYLLEKCQTPLLDKYGIYEIGRLYFDCSHYFQELNIDATIDRIIEVEKWYWKGDNCKNSKKTFALLDKIKKEDVMVKCKRKINYFEYEGNDVFRVVGF